MQMQKYLVDVSFPEEILASPSIANTFLESGSHFLTHADWAYEDGNHRGWLTVEASKLEDARWVVPPAFRATARVVRLSLSSIAPFERLAAKRTRQRSLPSLLERAIKQSQGH